MSENENCTDDNENEELPSVEWEIHLKASNSIWEHFKKSKFRSNSSFRYKSKCNYCAEIMDGKPQKMTNHLLFKCSKVPPEIRSTVALKPPPSATKENDGSAGPNAKTSGTNSKQKKIQSFSFPVEISDQDENDLNLAFLRAILSGGVAFNFADNYYLAEWMKQVKPMYKLPSQATLVDNHLVQLYVDAVAERDKNLESIDCCTALVDGWSDPLQNSIYSLMVLYGHDCSEILDILSVSKERHTADYLASWSETVLNESTVKISAIKCLVTDSPTFLLKYRRTMRHNFPQMITLPCALHVAITICKDICRIQNVRPIIKGNCLIVNFFLSSHAWFVQANQWASTRLNSSSFKSLYEAHWYSMCKVFMCISYYKEFLHEAALLNGTIHHYPTIKSEVLRCINDEHFISNKEIVEVIKPLSDLIGNLESPTTNLADITLGFLNLHMRYNVMANESIEVNPFVTETMSIVDKRFKQYFSEPVYVICLYLWPMYRDFATSKKYTAAYFVREIVTIAISWKYSKDQCIQLVQGLSKYEATKFNARQLEMTPSAYWNSSSVFGPPLCKFADFCFQLKGHAPPAETLFSGLPYSKPKIRNKMTTENMKIVGLIRKSLQRNNPTKSDKRKRKRNSDIITEKSNDSMASLIPELAGDADEIDYVAEIENIFNDDSDPLSDIPFLTNGTSYIDELFDMGNFENIEKNVLSYAQKEDNFEDCEEKVNIEDILNHQK